MADTTEERVVELAYKIEEKVEKLMKYGIYPDYEWEMYDLTSEIRTLMEK